MLPFSECPPAALAQVQGIFTDVDDTLTRHGKLAAATFCALHDLAAAGVAVIPITGGPASWADHIARVWPVAAAVGESGAVAYWLDAQGFTTLHAQDAQERAHNLHARDAAWHAIQARFPQARLAADQVFRLTDLAIDHGQDTHLPEAQVQEIAAFLQAQGFTVRVSSIHINAWLGGHDKPEAAVRVARARLGIDLLACAQRWLYIGDSRNDEGMFAQFPLSVGVANIAKVAATLRRRPAYITQGSHGEGFVEVAQAVLRNIKT
jgi:HAD superfamily hydrolase (TIGR01484 family)